MSIRVVITGGAGFIGRETARRLVLSGYEVVCFDLAEQVHRHIHTLNEIKACGDLHISLGSILDKSAVRQAISGAHIVIHLAAMLGVKKTEDDKLRCIEVNITGTDNVLSAAAAHGVKKVIFASSSEVYGEPDSNPISEVQTTKGKTVYAVTKIAGEELVKGYSQTYPDMNYTIVRFFNTYGEGQVAQFVLSRWVREVMAGRSPVVFGTGNQVRSYGHVDDVTRGLELILENAQSNGKVYNLGNSNQIMTLKELARKVIDIVAPDSGLGVEILGSFDGADRNDEREIHTRYCDTSLAAKDLGYAPKVSVDEGIRRIALQTTIHDDWPAL